MFKALLDVVFDIGHPCIRQNFFPEKSLTLVTNIFESLAAGKVRNQVAVHAVTVKKAENLNVVVYQDEHVVLISSRLVALNALELDLSVRQDLLQVCIRLAKVRIHFFFKEGFVVVEKDFIFEAFLRVRRVVHPRGDEYVVFEGDALLYVHWLLLETWIYTKLHGGGHLIYLPLYLIFTHFDKIID